MKKAISILLVLYCTSSVTQAVTGTIEGPDGIYSNVSTQYKLVLKYEPPKEKGAVKPSEDITWASLEPAEANIISIQGAGKGRSCAIRGTINFGAGQIGNLQVYGHVNNDVLAVPVKSVKHMGVKENTNN